MKTIPATKGHVILVDDEDYLKVCQYSWYAHRGSRSKTFYARARINYKLIFLHRYLTEVSRDIQIDHINGNGLDNRRSNLRLCSQAQNNANLPIPSHNSSGFKGVFKEGRSGKYRAQVQHQRVKRISPLFETPEEAALAYNAMAIEVFGAFARLNEVRA